MHPSEECARPVGVFRLREGLQCRSVVQCVGLEPPVRGVEGVFGLGGRGGETVIHLEEEGHDAGERRGESEGAKDDRVRFWGGCRPLPQHDVKERKARNRAQGPAQVLLCGTEEGSQCREDAEVWPLIPSGEGGAGDVGARHLVAGGAVPPVDGYELSNEVPESRVRQEAGGGRPLWLGCDRPPRGPLVALEDVVEEGRRVSGEGGGDVGQEEEEAPLTAAKGEEVTAGADAALVSEGEAAVSHLQRVFVCREGL